LIDTFKKLGMHGPAGAVAATAGIGAAGAAAAASRAEAGGSAHGASAHAREQGGASSSSSGAGSAAAAAAAGASISGKEALGGCPPDTSEIGNATWTFLHTMAAYYPEEPSNAQKSLMRSMMEGLAEFYPCSVCAEHLREQVAARPPDVSSNTTLSQWLCAIHNEVNAMLGKPAFDCARTLERWRDGPEDGSCD